MNKNSDTKEYILRQASEHNVKFVRLWFCDILGRLKGFAINVEDLEDCILLRFRHFKIFYTLLFTYYQC